MAAYTLGISGVLVDTVDEQRHVSERGFGWCGRSALKDGGAFVGIGSSPKSPFLLSELHRWRSRCERLFVSRCNPSLVVTLWPAGRRPSRATRHPPDNRRRPSRATWFGSSGQVSPFTQRTPSPTDDGGRPRRLGVTPRRRRGCRTRTFGRTCTASCLTPARASRKQRHWPWCAPWLA